MTYEIEETASTKIRILIAFLNSLTTLVILVVPFQQQNFQLPVLLSWLVIIGWLIFIAVNYIVLVRLYGGTLYHILFNLRIIHANGTHGLSWLQVGKRFLASSFLSFFTGPLSYAILFLNAERKHLGDLWAQTRVVSIKTRRKENPKAPRHVLFCLVLVIGVLSTFAQVKALTFMSIEKEGIWIGDNSASIDGIGVWSKETRDTFISHCSDISSEYLRIAMQGQGASDEIMKKFEESIVVLCSCVATEMEKSSFASQIDMKKIETRESFEALFEEEAFTAAYVQASATCESLLK